ncbi:MAG: TraC family protein [Patescibacteria group bacterium]
MQSKKLAKPKPGPATQRYLDIAEIREGMVILKDGTVRAVLMVGSINFALKSEDEQQALVQAYMQFLNGLDHPLQVVIQSRKMNIDAYIGALQEQYRIQKNELLRAQIQDYVAFVKQLVELGQIMSKRFFVVIPYDPLTNKTRNFIYRLTSALTPISTLKLKGKQYEERKRELSKRVEYIRGQMESMSLNTERLDTQGLIEMYYRVYNPEVAEVQSAGDLNKLQVEDMGTIITDYGSS